VSADRLIFEGSGIGRPADDSARWVVYLHLTVHLSDVARRRLDPVKLDRLVAAGLSILALAEIWLGSVDHRALVTAVALVATGSVAVRRTHPFAVGIVVPVLADVQLGLVSDPQIIATGIAYFCALYALAVWTPPRQFGIGLAVLVSGAFLAALGPHLSLSSTALFTVVSVVVMLLVRRVVGDRERRAQLAERERDVAAREAVVEERARIARELHDVIAHHVSMIVLQAGAERSILDESNASTREVLLTVEESGRSALTEMRRLLGILRDDRSEPLAPQPGLDDVPTLVGQLREAGLPVELQIEGDPRELPVGIQLSAYRIVQEALTNALKHAGNARARVNVRYGADSLELEIADDGGGVAARAPGGGHGLVGMRERVALYGGRFQANRSPGGGFVVKAALPLR
jgi:signal transduction histidine kinase